MNDHPSPYHSNHLRYWLRLHTFQWLVLILIVVFSILCVLLSVRNMRERVAPQHIQPTARNNNTSSGLSQKKNGLNHIEANTIINPLFYGQILDTGFFKIGAQSAIQTGSELSLLNTQTTINLANTVIQLKTPNGLLDITHKKLYCPQHTSIFLQNNEQSTKNIYRLEGRGIEIDYPAQQIRGTQGLNLLNNKINVHAETFFINGREQELHLHGNVRIYMNQ